MPSRLLPGFLLCFCLFLAGAAVYEGIEAKRWKRVADERGWQAEQAYTYLHAPTGIKDPQGKDVSRAQLLDLLLVSFLRSQPK